MPIFVPRERKHKVRARQEKGTRSNFNESVDSNAVELSKTTPSEKESRRQALREELRSQQNVKSSKKQKRLDKYIVIIIVISCFPPNVLTVPRIKNCGKRKTLI